MLKDSSRTKLWSIGGGKGGIGKSLVTLGLGISLARLGKKVILIDGDLGGANLHTLMGVRYPEVTLEDFLLKRVDRLEDTVIQTAISGIGLICGADDILGSANPTYAQKIRLLRQIEELPAQYVLLDLGAGTSFNILDFFNNSPGKIALFTSQITSLQNAYGFIKSALYRKLSRDFAKDDALLNLMYHVGGRDADDPHSIPNILASLKETDPPKHARLVRSLEDFQLFLIVNMVRSQADLKSPEIIRSVCEDFLQIRPEVLGQVAYDAALETAISQSMPLPLYQKKGKAAAGLEQMAVKIVKASRLPKPAWKAEEGPEEDQAVAPVLAQPSFHSGT